MLWPLRDQCSAMVCVYVCMLIRAHTVSQANFPFITSVLKCTSCEYIVFFICYVLICVIIMFHIAVHLYSFSFTIPVLKEFILERLALKVKAHTSGTGEGTHRKAGQEVCVTEPGVQLRKEVPCGVRCFCLSAKHSPYKT